jgi:hypothetical protein
MTAALQSIPLARSRIFQEVLLMAFGYLVYSQVRGLAGDRVSDAFINAYNLIDIERDLGIFKELTVQQWVLPNATLVHIFNLIYFYCFFPLVIPSAIFLFVTRPQVYKLARNAFLISGGIAVCFFLLLPTAPPRLVGMGFIDTLNQSLTPTYSSIPGVNHYAALPSMHVGWTFLLAVALFMAFKGRRFRPLFFLLPVMMFTATVVTGNHYFLDGLLGLVVAGASLRFALLLQSRGQERGEELIEEAQAPSSV